jgi:hypothetical protein
MSSYFQRKDYQNLIPISVSVIPCKSSEDMSNENRGLALTEEEIRERVAKGRRRSKSTGQGSLSQAGQLLSDYLIC